MVTCQTLAWRFHQRVHVSQLRRRRQGARRREQLGEVYSLSIGQRHSSWLLRKQRGWRRNAAAARSPVLRWCCRRVVIGGRLEGDNFVFRWHFAM